ncbi:TIR domain-containing protein [uncultured Clostridium sp.]|uniref:TIR domain-containing protein n=1 Tax=uncultured Clostridium sp. TaxID=59620 RepID=UPI00262D8D99|nr:TIR domain-containing protein [uncultured Clostridium sp.]
MSNRRYDIFISHAWTADSDYNGLIRLLDSDRSFIYRNYSVPRSNPLEINATTELSRKSQLSTKLREQVRQASVVIIIAGMYFNHREWIQKEIDLANEMSKPILVVRPWGQERIPIELQKYKMVYWNTTSIISGIKDVVNSKVFI